MPLSLDHSPSELARALLKLAPGDDCPSCLGMLLYDVIGWQKGLAGGAKTPEQEARSIIDQQLLEAGWLIQDRDEINLSAGRGIAIREFRMTAGYGFADYLLYLDKQAIGALEAKPAAVTLSGVRPQIDKYSAGLPSNLPAPMRPLPFLYVSTGIETSFINLLDPEARSRRVFSFHRPETIAEWLQSLTLTELIRGWGGCLEVGQAFRGIVIELNYTAFLPAK